MRYIGHFQSQNHFSGFFRHCSCWQELKMILRDCFRPFKKNSYYAQNEGSGSLFGPKSFFFWKFSLQLFIGQKREIGVILGVKINDWSNQGSFVALYLVKLNISCTCLGDCHMAITSIHTGRQCKFSRIFNVSVSIFHIEGPHFRFLICIFWRSQNSTLLISNLTVLINQSYFTGQCILFLGFSLT